MSSGFRLGWVSGPKTLVDRIQLDQQVCSCVLSHLTVGPAERARVCVRVRGERALVMNRFLRLPMKILWLQFAEKKLKVYI